MTTPTDVSVEPRDETNQEQVDGIAATYVAEARDLFQRITVTKEAFFRQIFDDGAWREFDWLSPDSRQFSTLVTAIWRQVKAIDGGIQLPSQTEVSDWFWLFTRQKELTDRGVPEQLIPSNRGASNALAALSKAVPEGQRFDAEAELLQQLKPDQPVTAKAIKGLAPPKLKPPSVHDIVGKPLEAIGPATWETICQKVAELRLTAARRGDPADTLATIRGIAAVLADCSLIVNASAIAVVDDDLQFVGWGWAQLKPNPRRGQGGASAWVISSYVATSDVPADAATVSSALPKPTSDDDQAQLLATASDLDGIERLSTEIGLQLGHAALGVPLSTWQWWQDQGGAPKGISWDDLTKRKAQADT